jgi:OOP family OmpA-OmpF porin
MIVSSMRNSLGDLWKWAPLGALPLALAFSLTNASAQSAPPFDPAIDVQLFDMSPGPRTFMGVADGSTEEKGQYSLDFLLTFLTDPFVIYNVDENDDTIINKRTDVVSSLFAGQLTGAYGLTNGLHLGVSLPLVFSMRGDGLDPSSGDMASGGLQATGLGDLRFEAKGRILRSSTMGVAWMAGLTVPTSFGAGGNDYLGDDLPAARGGVAAHYDVADGLVRMGANLGVVLRKPRQIYASEVGQQLTYGAGAALNITEDFSVIGEAFGRTALTAIELDASPLEVGAGMRAKATDSFSILAGGGIGVVSGIGSPGLRFVVSVGYAPDLGDSDGDGISNMRDKCPLIEEDFDEFEDSDGCPENDNDGDRREDSVDKCPNDKEDIDGFEDEDGCPETDNDGDKILDADDRCPQDAEDGRSPYSKDGCPADKRDSDDDGVSDLHDQCPDDYEDEDDYEDWDGCPEADNDHDGIADEDDNCPLCPEDMDGFNDTDGCPDLDNDNDGIADSADACPDKPETINDNADDDGCPDSGAALATLDGNRLLLAEEPRFTSSNTLRNRRTLAAVARIMRMQSDVRLWRIVVATRKQATDELTRAKSQAQADAIRMELIRGGLAEDRVEAVGAVSSNAVIAFAAVERGDADQEFICPESLQAKGRPKPETAELAPAMAPTAAAAPVQPVATPTSAPVAAAAVAELPGEMQGSQGIDGAIRLKRGKAAFVGKTAKRLDVLVSMLNNNFGTRLEFLVHTDGNKGETKALEISTSQAQFLVDYVVKAGIDASRVAPVGKGMSEPVGDNKTSKGRDKNRRVEIRFSLL